MKRALKILAFMCFIGANSQEINISQEGTVNTCSATFVDSGGTTGAYQNNENYTITICPDTAGTYIQFNFSSFDVEGEPWDFLTFYEGTDTTGAIIGTFGDELPPDLGCVTAGDNYIASSDSSGCVTIVFESDGSITNPGWEATVSCVTIAGGEAITGGTEPPANATCEGSDAFCANGGALEFPNSSSNDCVDDAPDLVVDNSCLGSAPNPAWYFIQVDIPGNMEFEIEQTTQPGGQGTGLDVDYVLWGPFSTRDEMCMLFDFGDCNGDHDCSGTVIDCSYSADSIENATIANAQQGAYYLFLITNFNGDPGFITLTQTNEGQPGAGSTDCSIVCPEPLAADSTCNGANGTITLATVEPNTSYQITYDYGGETVGPVDLTSNNDGEIIIENLLPGLYTNITTNIDGCEMITTSVEVMNQTGIVPVISGISGELLYCSGDFRILTADVVDTNVSYQWQFNSVDIVGETNETIQANMYGDYSVVVTGSNNCSSNFTVTTTQDNQCIIPNGISPNNDSLNDYFDVSWLNATNLQMFNRYGNKVYEKANYRKEFNGVSDAGQELPTGTYYYVLDLPSSNALKGWLYINREN